MRQSMDEFVEEVSQLFERHGGIHYGPEPVTILQHSMQCAALAAKMDLDDNLIVAAGLHDIGHLRILDVGDHYTDGGDHHEHIGAESLEPWLPGAVVSAIRWHVEAKRYLVAHDPAYAATLSEGSVASLERQGGPMRDAEMLVFSNTDAFADAIVLRKLDDAAKVPDDNGMPLNEFLAIIERVRTRRL